MSMQPVGRATASLAGLGVAVVLSLTIGMGRVPPHPPEVRQTLHPMMRAVELRVSLVTGARIHQSTSLSEMRFVNTMHAQAHLLRSMALDFVESHSEADVEVNEYLKEAGRISAALASIDISSKLVHPGVVTMADVRLGWGTNILDETDRERLSLLMISTGLASRKISENRINEPLPLDITDSPDLSDPGVRGGHGFIEIEYIVPRIFRMNVRDDHIVFQNDIDEALREGLIGNRAVDAIKDSLN